MSVLYYWLEKQKCIALNCFIPWSLFLCHDEIVIESNSLATSPDLTDFPNSITYKTYITYKTDKSSFRKNRSLRKSFLRRLSMSA